MRKHLKLTGIITLVVLILVALSASVVFAADSSNSNTSCPGICQGQGNGNCNGQGTGTCTGEARRLGNCYGQPGNDGTCGSNCGRAVTTTK